MRILGWAMAIGRLNVTVSAMDWTHFESMDPHLLVGLVNTALRNHYGDLDELCAAEGIDQESLKQRLAVEGYEYNATARQFR